MLTRLGWPGAASHCVSTAFPPPYHSPFTVSFTAVHRGSAVARSVHPAGRPQLAHVEDGGAAAAAGLHFGLVLAAVAGPAVTASGGWVEVAGMPLPAVLALVETAGKTLPLPGVSTVPARPKTPPLPGVSTAFVAKDTASAWCFHCLRGQRQRLFLRPRPAGWAAIRPARRGAVAALAVTVARALVVGPTRRRRRRRRRRRPPSRAPGRRHPAAGPAAPARGGAAANTAAWPGRRDRAAGNGVRHGEHSADDGRAHGRAETIAGGLQQACSADGLRPLPLTALASASCPAFLGHPSPFLFTCSLYCGPIVRGRSHPSSRRLAAAHCLSSTFHCLCSANPC